MTKDDTIPGVRLQKYLAQQGLASRRRCEQFIAEGLVKVNGKVVTQKGTRVRPGSDRVEVNSQRIDQRQGTQKTILLYKPRGYVCTRSRNEGRNIFDLLGGLPPGLALAGRLDKNSEGLVILSEDGDLVHRLTHPRFNHEKCYQVTVSGTSIDKAVAALNKPMRIDGYQIRSATVRLMRRSTKDGRYILEVVLKEGRNRQIRKMCKTVGLRIHRLVRTRIEHLTKAGLKPGQWRALKSDSIKPFKA